MLNDFNSASYFLLLILKVVFYKEGFLVIYVSLISRILNNYKSILRPPRVPLSLRSENIQARGGVHTGTAYVYSCRSISHTWGYDIISGSNERRRS
jgi:hypothetical protein